MKFGQRLRELRKARGIALRKLAEEAGIDFTYLSKIETGAMPPPSEEAIMALASTLNVDPDELFALAKKMPSHLLEELSIETIKMLRTSQGREDLQKDSRPTLDQGVRIRTGEEDAIRGRERLFQELVEHSLDGILIMNSDLDIVYESPTAARILGYNPGELTGKDALGMLHKDDVSMIAHGLTELAQNPGATGRAEARLRHKDGMWRVIEAVAVNLIHNPVINGILLNFRDITERRREEETEAQYATASAVAQEHNLTESEKRVLALMIMGYSNPQIAERLVTSHSTVKFHVSNILSKLDVANRTEAVALALQHHLIT